MQERVSMMTSEHTVKQRVQALNPLTYGAMMMVLVLGALLYGWQFVIFELLVLFLWAAWLGIFKEFFNRWLKSALFLTVIVVTFQVLLMKGGQVITHFLIFDITTYGVQRAITLGSRLLGIFTPIIFLLTQINIDDLIKSMEQKGVNANMTYIIASSFNMIPQMRKKLQVITDAQKARGIEMEGNLLTRFKAVLPILGSVVLSSIVDVEEKMITLEVRGFYYTKNKTIVYPVQDTPLDHRLRWLSLMVAVAFVGGKVFLWLR